MKARKTLKAIQEAKDKAIEDIIIRFKSKGQINYPFNDFEFEPDRASGDTVKGLIKKRKGKVRVQVEFEGEINEYNLNDDVFTPHDTLHILRIMETQEEIERKNKK